jgi:hypothetical protein
MCTMNDTHLKNAQKAQKIGSLQLRIYWIALPTNVNRLHNRIEHRVPLHKVTFCGRVPDP